MEYKIVFIGGEEIVTQTDIQKKIEMALMNGLDIDFIGIEDRFINIKNILYIEELSKLKQ